MLFTSNGGFPALFSQNRIHFRQNFRFLRFFPFPCSTLTPLFFCEFPRRTFKHRIADSDSSFGGKMFRNSGYQVYPSPSLCVLLAMWSLLVFYKSVFPILMGIIMMMEFALSLKVLTRIGSFGSGFFVFGFRFSLGNALIVFFVAVGLGIRVFQFGGLKGFHRKLVCDDESDRGILKESRKIEKPGRDHQLDEKDDDFVEEEEDDDDVDEVCGEDEECSVVQLREMVKEERRRGNAATRDLEKERMAAASAAEEAMSMILRLQSEKGALQIEATQAQRLGEEKQGYDQEVIASLQQALMQYEDERGLMVQQVWLCKKRLRMYLPEDDIELLDCMTSPCSRSMSRPRMAGRRLEDSLIGTSLG